MKRAVVLLSGGLDSATAMAVAKSQGYEVYALSVDYGQRHKVELQRGPDGGDRRGDCPEQTHWVHAESAATGTELEDAAPGPREPELVAPLPQALGADLHAHHPGDRHDRTLHHS